MRAEYQTVDIKDIKILAKWVDDHKPQFSEPYAALWNLFAKSRKLPVILKLNDTRRRKLAIRLREPGFDFVAILRKAASSEFVIEGNWFTLDWLLENEKNYLKVLEGNYVKKRPPGEGPPPGAGGAKLANAVAKIEQKLKAENGIEPTTHGAHA